jgi:molybdate transport system substrate-binding protein
MEYFFDRHKIDISIGYCSSRETTPDPKFANVQLPADLAVTADYGLTVLVQGKGSRDAALRFALFIMSPEAQHVISLYGFDPVSERKGEL